MAALLFWGISKAAAPVLLYPVNAIDTQAVKLKFAFHPVAGMQFYDVQIDTTPFFNSSLLKDSVGVIDYSSLSSNDTIIKVVYSLYYGTTQYWRVRGRNATDTSDWSEVRSFTPRNFPLVLNPSNNQAFPTLVGASTMWKNIGGSTSYQVQVGSTSVFISPIYIYTTTSITHDYPHFWNISVALSAMPQSANYFLRIKAYNEIDSSDWSPELHFTILEQLLVEEHELNAFSVFPNPANVDVNVLFEGDAQLSIFDVEGKEVYQTTINAVATKIDISTLSQGTYFMQLNTGDRIVVQKLVVTK